METLKAIWSWLWPKVRALFEKAVNWMDRRP